MRGMKKITVCSVLNNRFQEKVNERKEGVYE